MCSVSHTKIPHIGPAGSTTIPDKYLPVVSRSLKLLQAKMRNAKSCNDDFSTLPGGKTFRELFDNAAIWVNYDPLNNGSLWGWTMPTAFPNDVVLTQYPLRMGYWSTAATIVHELAHLNGADGTTHAAEHTVKSCLMKSKGGPYDPNIIGRVVHRRVSAIV